MAVARKKTKKTKAAANNTSLRALTLLEYVSAASRPVSTADITNDFGFPRATAHRLLLQLESEGYLEREPDGTRFLVGPRFAKVALNALVNSAERGARDAILRSLADEIGETCNFTVADGSELVFIHRVEANWPLRLDFHAGSRVPLHCTASGKLLLAFMPARQSQRIVAAAPLKRYTDNTVTNPKRLMAELERIRADRLSTDDEEYLAGMIGVAVPVLDRSNRVCAGLAVHALAARMSLEVAKQYVPTLRKASAALTAACFPE